MLIVAAVLLVAFGCVVFVMMHNAQKTAAVTMCANNLSQLWKIQNVYMSKFGGKTKSLPDQTGEAFWLALSKTKPPLVNAAESSLYECPVAGAHSTCDYRGPGVAADSLPEGAVVGADKAGNHSEGGNVLRKSGDVVEHPDPEFRRITSDLRP